MMTSEQRLRCGNLVCRTLTMVVVCLGTLAPGLSQFGSNIQQFSQVVLNQGSTTSFTIHNPSDSKTISVVARLYAPNGDPLANQQVELAPGETKTVTFGDANAPLTRGWAELSSDDPFIATEFFQLFLNELKPRVGVLQSPLGEEIRFLGFVNQSFKSGLAVHNPSPTESTEITIRIKDNQGQQPVPEKSLNLSPRQSEAVFLNDELLFGADLESFEGVVEISVNSSPVAALSLIQEANGDTATVTVETQHSPETAPPDDETSYIFPLVMAGELDDGSLRDGVFFVTNVDGRPANCELDLNGMPNTEVEGAGSLATLGSVAIAQLEAERDPPGVEVGYARLACDIPVAAAFSQSFDPPGEAPAEALTVIGPAAPSSLASIPTGWAASVGTVQVAIVNDNSAAAEFDVSVLDLSDASVGTARVNIPGGTQFVADIFDLIPELTPEVDFSGSIRISSVDGSTRFYAAGLAREGTAVAATPAVRLAP